MRTAKDFKFRFFIVIDGESLRGEGSLDNLSTLRFVNSAESTIFQFTGMQDSEGNDIYEGDILSVSWEGENNIYLVEYCAQDGYPAFDLEGSQSGSREGEANGLASLRWYDGYEYKVIGNIYEHPELLEDKS